MLGNMTSLYISTRETNYTRDSGKAAACSELRRIKFLTLKTGFGKIRLYEPSLRSVQKVDMHSDWFIRLSDRSEIAI